jgi:hypothetical protein
LEEYFDEIEDKNLQKRLLNTLSNRKPFANFKNIIDNSEFRVSWFTFKQMKLEELVWGNLSSQLIEDKDANTII